MDYPVEFVANSANAFAESKYFDKFYDVVTGGKNNPHAQPKPAAAISDTARPRGDPLDPAPRQQQKPPSSVAHRSKRRVSPSPDRYDLDEESVQSERVLREYEAERDDPSRKPTASLVAKSTGGRTSKDDRRDSTRMSYANGGQGYGRSERGERERPTSQRGGSKYDDYYEDDYESDYDDRTGRRTKTTGRGYDADRDREFDREIIETERYRGVSHITPKKHVSLLTNTLFSPLVTKMPAATNRSTIPINPAPTKPGPTFLLSKTTRCNPTVARKTT